MTAFPSDRMAVRKTRRAGASKCEECPEEAKGRRGPSGPVIRRCEKCARSRAGALRRERRKRRRAEGLCMDCGSVALGRFARCAVHLVKCQQRRERKEDVGSLSVLAKTRASSMTTERFARWARVDRATVNRWIARGELTATKVGKLWCIPASELRRIRGTMPTSILRGIMQAIDDPAIDDLIVRAAPAALARIAARRPPDAVLTHRRTSELAVEPACEWCGGLGCISCAAGEAAKV